MKKTDRPKEFVAYYRVSSKKQMKDKNGLSIEEQRAAVVARVEREGGRIIQEFIEVHSAWVNTRLKGKERPVLKKAIEMCKENNYTIIVSTISRFARDVEFAFFIKNNGVNIMAADLAQLDNLTFTIYASIYQEQSDAASKKIGGIKALQKAKGIKMGWHDQKTHPDNRIAGLMSGRAKIYRFFLQDKYIKLHQLLVNYSEMYKDVPLTKVDLVTYPKRMYLERESITAIVKHINKFERPVFELKDKEMFDNKKLRYMIDQLRRNAKGFRHFFGDDATMEDAEDQFLSVGSKELLERHIANNERQSKCTLAKEKREIKQKISPKKQQTAEEYLRIRGDKESAFESKKQTN